MIDFAKRVSARKVNKKVMEALTMAGAFDSIAEVNRASLFSSLEALLDYGSDEQAERELGQTSLFDSFQSDEIKLSIPMDRLFKQETDWPQSRKLLLEKQVVGFFVSGHPLDQWQHICDEWLGWNTEKITQFFKDKKENAPAVEEPSERKDWRNRPTKPEVKLCGLVSEMREVMTKKGSRMAFGMVEDLYGKLECVIFPEAYAKLGDMISQATAQAEAVIVVAELELASDLPKLLVKELLWVKDAHQNRVQNVVIRLNTQGISEEHLRALKKQLIQHRGRCPVKIEFVGDQFKTELKLPEGTGLSGTPQMVAAINQIFNAQVVHLV
jgi:DNA polymerase-3 subunit alpha